MDLLLFLSAVPVLMAMAAMIYVIWTAVVDYDNKRDVVFAVLMTIMLSIALPSCMLCELAASPVPLISSAGNITLLIVLVAKIISLRQWHRRVESSPIMTVIRVWQLCHAGLPWWYRLVIDDTFLAYSVISSRLQGSAMSYKDFEVLCGESPTWYSLHSVETLMSMAIEAVDIPPASSPYLGSTPVRQQPSFDPQPDDTTG